MRLSSPRRRAALSAAGALLLAAGALPLSLGAQRAPRYRSLLVGAGDTVRVRARGGAAPAEPARVVALRRDTLVLVTPGGGDARIPLDSITRLEVADGRRSRRQSAAQGARTAAVILGSTTVLATGVALAADLGGGRSCVGACIPASPLVLASGLLVTGVGSLAGAAIGYASRPGARWRRVTVPARVGVGPGPAGATAVAVSLPLRF